MKGFDNHYKHACFSREEYKELYKFSIDNPEQFWAEQANKFITWYKPWETTLAGNLVTGDVSWFVNGKLNACYNCVDRHLDKRSSQIAIIWQSEQPEISRKITYLELYKDICKFANVLKKQGIQKGDRVCIYMPMIPETIIAILACARIGAIHTVVFAGFSAESLRKRIDDSKSKLIITVDGTIRAGKYIPLLNFVNTALADCVSTPKVIVVEKNGQTKIFDSNVCLYSQEMQQVSYDCPCEVMDASDPLFILYTSGSTGEPKGILHSVAGYLVYVATTFKYIFNYCDNDIYWATADVGWITGHSYLVYGPLLNAATILMYEGTPFYPKPNRYWEIIEKYRVNIFYTAPTVIRSLMQYGDEYVKQHDKQSLKVLGSVGEPINPKAWEWYYNVVGEARCPIVDTWWQTETGGIMITPLPGVMPLKPGSATLPFLGIKPEIVDDDGCILGNNQEGNLVITNPWPGMMTTLYNDEQRFKDNYLQKFKNVFYTGDAAFKDQDGYYWIAGRVDDVINVSGQRLGTAEVEGALIAHPNVSEAAAIGMSHPIKGQVIFTFVTLMPGVEENDLLQKELKIWVKKRIGAIAIPEKIKFILELPKTRSGKIMRRILKKIINNDIDNLGDVSTLIDLQVVQDIINSMQK